MEIKVLGPGCPRCEATERNVMDALSELGISANVEKVKNPMDIANYGVFGTPAVVIEGQVKCVGRIPTKEEIKMWLQEKK